MHLQWEGLMHKKRHYRGTEGKWDVPHVLISWTCELCCDWLKQFLPAFEESNINRRRVEVDKLEDENFEDEHVFKLRLSSMHL